MHMRGNKLEPQLLLKQSDTLPTQKRYIENLHEDVWFQNYFDKMSALWTAIFLFTFEKGLGLCLDSAYTGNPGTLHTQYR